MKFKGTLDHGVPVHRGRARRHGDPRRAGRPTASRACASTPSASTGSAAIPRSSRCSRRSSAVPLDRLGRKVADIDVYSTELHNPEITEPAGGYDVPERNYRLLAALAVMRGELGRDEMDGLLPASRPARLLADPGPHRLGGALGPARPATAFASGELQLDDADGQGQPVPGPHDPDVGCRLRDRGGVNGCRSYRRDLPGTGRVRATCWSTSGGRAACPAWR